MGGLQGIVIQAVCSFTATGATRQLRLRRMDREGQDEATVATLRMTAGMDEHDVIGISLRYQKIWKQVVNM